MASAPKLNAPNSPSGSSIRSFEEGFGTLPPNTVAIPIGPPKRKNLRKASRKNRKASRKASRKNRKASRKNRKASRKNRKASRRH
jgi:hypothetical protein